MPLSTACRLLPAATALLVATAGSASAQSLRGSRASVQRMHRHAVAERLHFYRTTAGVRTAAKRGTLVALAGSADLLLDGVALPYARPAARLFVERLAAQYREACGDRLVVTGAIRPTARRPANGSARSVHPTGIALDLRKPAGACRTWLRSTLLSLERAGVLEATEEFRPPHFHVAVFPTPYTRHVTRLTGRAPVARATITYAVREGDTLWRIAHRHGVSVDDLAEANDLSGSVIRPGQELVIPAGDSGR